MPPSADLFEFVIGSDARRTVLRAIAASPASAQDVLEEVDASQSSVYAALSDLGEHGLATEEDGEWSTTGSGRLVADSLDQLAGTAAVVESDQTYWERHDTTVLPRRHREDIHELAGCEVVRSPEADPFRSERRVEAAIRDADTVAIVAPVYHDRYAEAMMEADAGEVRLLMHSEMVARVVEERPAGPDGSLDHMDIRVTDANFSVVLTDDTVSLSLPLLSGGFEFDTDVIATDERAVAWGRRLFDDLWADAVPVERYVVEELGAEDYTPPE